ncbi:glycosyltransferase family 32 protein [Streptomyces sp. NRRL B-1347]|uniref:glycosyltransferase family 32 protein n=1 Tax=Streptomyces sp. NRRL B-1347 TaxID=1476877 RepID=UPI0004CB96E7|nr:glycosyltransferase [Streptomyces sp. NRRL B-1347]
MTAAIPRLIHWIWIGSPVPARFEAYRDTWASAHPDWEMRVWTDDNLPPMYNQHLYDQAADYAPASMVGQFRADVLRYELLWQYGGVYVDADFECLQPITPLLDGIDAFAAWETDGRRIANGLMGAARSHRFIGRLITDLEASAARHKGARPAISTGPAYLTTAYREHPGELAVLPSRLFYPYLWSELDSLKARPPWPAHCYAVHHWHNRRKHRGEAP